jgi:hypothetical protein
MIGGRRSARRRRGVTLLDVALLIGSVLLLVHIVSRVPELIDYTHRKACYQNQALLDKVLYDVLQEKKAEVTDVAVAYAYRNTQRPELSKIVVLFKPKPDAYWEPPVVKPIPNSIFPRNLSCPVHPNANTAEALIDYAYLWGRWRCLQEKNHN